MNTATADEAVTASWTQDVTAKTDRWNISMPDAGGHAYICQYEGRDDYYWMAYRLGGEMSGIVVGREAAMRTAAEMMAMPIDAFREQVVAELRDKLRGIERDILRVMPAAEILPGYQAGFEAGYAACRQRIETALNLVVEHEVFQAEDRA